MTITELQAIGGKQMFFMATSMFPNHKTVEVRMIYSKASEKPFPPFVKLLQMYVLPELEPAGTKIIRFFEVEDAKVTEGYTEIIKFFRNYHGIEGFGYDIRPVMTREQSNQSYKSS
jgi:hypothetical protein